MIAAFRNCITITMLAICVLPLPAANTSPTDLVDLALRHFPTGLSETEKNFLSFAQAGKVCDLRSGDPVTDAPTNFKNWSDKRTIRTELVEWLCTSTNASGAITHRGISIVGARMEGALDLVWANVPFPLTFGSCGFPEGIKMTHAQLAGLSLKGSLVNGFDGESMQVTNDLHFSEGFRVEHRFNIRNTSIGGNLNLGEGTFVSTERTAIFADSIQVKGTVFANRSYIQGEFRLGGATIGGSLRCTGAIFVKTDNTALSLDNAKIRGDVDFNDINFTGRVILTLAQIGGSVFSTKGTFSNPNDVSIEASGVRVDGGFFLQDTKCIGAVRLPASRISGPVELRSTHLTNSSGETLNADGAGFNSLLLLQNVNSDGTIRMLGATIGVDFIVEGGSFTNPKNVAIGADCVEVKGGFYMVRGVSTHGFVRFSGMKIGQNLDLSNSSFINPEGDALLADQCSIEGNANLRGAHFEGEVFFRNARISGNLDCTDTTLSNPNRQAFTADSTQVGGSSIFSGKFAATGIINLRLTKTSGTLFWNASENAQNAILDLGYARTSTLADSSRSWPVEGNLRLDGFTYERIQSDSPLDVESRKKWLKLQPKDSFSPETYERLAIVYRTMGRESDAIDILVEKNRVLTESYKWYQIFQRFGWEVVDLVSNYGYKPWRAFGFSILWIFVGTVIFASAFKSGFFTATDPNRF